MEFTIKKIISIDKDVENYKKVKKKEMEDKEKKIEIELMNIRKEANYELQKYKVKIENELIEKAQLESKKIIEEKDNRKKNISLRYNSIKNDITNSVVEQILNSYKEE